MCIVLLQCLFRIYRILNYIFSAQQAEAFIFSGESKLLVFDHFCANMLGLISAKSVSEN